MVSLNIEGLSALENAVAAHGGNFSTGAALLAEQKYHKELQRIAKLFAELSNKGKPSILEQVGTLPLRSLRRFVVTNMFVEGKANICTVDDSFKDHFYGMTESAVRCRDARIHRPLHSPHDEEVIGALGKTAHIYLAHLFSIIYAQGRFKGQSPSQSFFAYANDKNGIPCTIQFFWHDDLKHGKLLGSGWFLQARPTRTKAVERKEMSERWCSPTHDSDDRIVSY